MPLKSANHGRMSSCSPAATTRALGDNVVRECAGLLTEEWRDAAAECSHNGRAAACSENVLRAELNLTWQAQHAGNLSERCAGWIRHRAIPRAGVVERIIELGTELELVIFEELHVL